MSKKMLRHLLKYVRTTKCIIDETFRRTLFILQLVLEYHMIL